MSRSKQVLCLIAVLFAALAVASAQDSKLGVGRPATPAEIKAWDITIFPDGSGLPPGEGAPKQGAEVYDRRCKECHGPEAKGAEDAALVGGHETLASENLLKTAVGFWPHATTLFDYIRRAMPFERPGTLTDDQVYALVAYLLSLDGVIKPDDVMNAETLAKVEMPNRNGFVPDPRPDTGTPHSGQ